MTEAEWTFSLEEEWAFCIVGGTDNSTRGEWVFLLEQEWAFLFFDGGKGIFVGEGIDISIIPIKSRNGYFYWRRNGNLNWTRAGHFHLGRFLHLVWNRNRLDDECAFVLKERFFYILEEGL